MQDTWKLSSPLSTHWREAGCREVRCPKYTLGWKTILPRTDLANIAYLKTFGLRYKEEQNDPLLVTFVFEPGQECFEGRLGHHRTLLDRPPIFTVSRHGNRRVLEWERWVNDMDKDLRQIKRIREG